MQNAFPVSEEGVHLVFYVFTPYDYLPQDFLPVVDVVVYVPLSVIFAWGK
jgi:hypothetical protein